MEFGRFEIFWIDIVSGSEAGMIVPLTDLPFLEAVEAVVNSVLSLVAPPVKRRLVDGSEISLRCRELTAIGDQLLTALRLERQIFERGFRNADDDELELLRQCRGTVEQLTKDYLFMIDDWRQRADEEHRSNHRVHAVLDHAPTSSTGAQNRAPRIVPRT